MNVITGKTKRVDQINIGDFALDTFSLFRGGWLMNCCPPDLWSLQHGAPSWPGPDIWPPETPSPWNIERSRDEFAACGPGRGGHNTKITTQTFYCRDKRERSKEEFIIPFQFHHRIVCDRVCILYLRHLLIVTPWSAPWSRGPGYIYQGPTQSGDNEDTALLTPARNDSVLYFSCFSNLIVFCCDKSCQSLCVPWRMFFLHFAGIEPIRVNFITLSKPMFVGQYHQMGNPSWIMRYWTLLIVPSQSVLPASLHSASRWSLPLMFMQIRPKLPKLYPNSV